MTEDFTGFSAAYQECVIEPMKDGRLCGRELKERNDRAVEMLTRMLDRELDKSKDKSKW